MKKCAVKRGFFTLSDCEQQAVAVCEQCQRPACQTHLAKTFGLCKECQVLQDELNNTLKPHDVFKTRREYYLDGYQPIYIGRQLSDYYDSYEIRAFETKMDSPSDTDQN